MWNVFRLMPLVLPVAVILGCGSHLFETETSGAAEQGADQKAQQSVQQSERVGDQRPEIRLRTDSEGNTLTEVKGCYRVFAYATEFVPDSAPGEKVWILFGGGVSDRAQVNAVRTNHRLEYDFSLSVSNLGSRNQRLVSFSSALRGALPGELSEAVAASVSVEKKSMFSVDYTNSAGQPMHSLGFWVKGSEAFNPLLNLDSAHKPAGLRDKMAILLDWNSTYTIPSELRVLNAWTRFDCKDQAQNGPPTDVF